MRFITFRASFLIHLPRIFQPRDAPRSYGGPPSLRRKHTRNPTPMTRATSGFCCPARGYRRVRPRQRRLLSRRHRPTYRGGDRFGICLFLFAVGMFAACDGGPESPADWVVEGGETLAQASARSGPVVAFVLDPSQCFSCTSLLSQWLDWRATNPDQFMLVLSRPPQRWERLRLAPLPVSATLSTPVESRLLPVELVFSDGSLVYQSPRLFGLQESPLLSETRDMPLEQTIKLMASDRAHSVSRSQTPTPQSTTEVRDGTQNQNR